MNHVGQVESRGDAEGQVRSQTPQVGVRVGRRSSSDVTLGSEREQGRAQTVDLMNDGWVDVEQTRTVENKWVAIWQSRRSNSMGRNNRRLNWGGGLNLIASLPG